MKTASRGTILIILIFVIEIGEPVTRLLRAIVSLM